MVSVRQICLFGESLKMFYKGSKVGMWKNISAAGFPQTRSPTIHYTFHETIDFIFCVVKIPTMLIYLTGVTFRQFYFFSMMSGGTSDFLFTDRETKFGDRDDLCIMSIPVRLPGPMFHLGVFV